MQDRLTNSGCAARTPQVAERVQRMEKAIAHLSEVREQVEARLGTILMPAAPCGTAPGKDKAMAVPLAEELDRLTDQINGLRMSLENMLSRVEL